MMSEPTTTQCFRGKRFPRRAYTDFLGTIEERLQRGWADESADDDVTPEEPEWHGDLVRGLWASGGDYVTEECVDAEYDGMIRAIGSVLELLEKSPMSAADLKAAATAIKEHSKGVKCRFCRLNAFGGIAIALDPETDSEPETDPEPKTDPDATHEAVRNNLYEGLTFNREYYDILLTLIKERLNIHVDEEKTSANPEWHRHLIEAEYSCGGGFQDQDSLDEMERHMLGSIRRAYDFLDGDSLSGADLRAALGAISQHKSGAKCQFCHS